MAASKRRFRLLVLIATLLAMAFHVAASAAEVQGTISIDVALPEGHASVAGRVILSEQGGSGEPATREVAVEIPATATIPLEPEKTWKVEIEAPGYWSREQFVPPALGERPPLFFRLFPTGTLAGRLIVAEGEEAPTSLTARFESSPDSAAGEPAISRAHADCPIAESRFSCELPAGLLDSRLRAQGFVSHFLWDLAIEAGQTRDAGTLIFRRGGSVVSWVEIAEGEQDFEGVKIHVEPALASRSRDPERQERLGLTASVNERGFLHVSGVQPGEYRISAHHDGGLDAGAPRRIEVLPNAEASIESPFVLQPPARFEVWVEPPVGPEGERWTVQLLELDPGGGSISPVEIGRLSEAGDWASSDLSRGRYFLAVVDSSGSRWFFEEVEVRDARERRFVTLDLFDVEGRVLLGEDPLEATLWFGGRHGARTFKMESDAEGSFTGVLPEGREWQVDVVAEKPPLKRTRLVEVEAPEGGGSAEVEIVFPNTVLEGEVVTADGSPAPGATVLLLESHLAPKAVAMTSTRVDEDGRFTFHGLEEEAAYVLGAQRQAIGPVETSARHEIRISKGAAPPFVTLELVPKVELRGQVIGSYGKVPGVLILAQPWVVDRPAGMLTPRGQTDVEGRFRLSVPQKTERVTLTIVAPGYAFQMLEIPFRGESAELTIPVSQNWGTLVLRAEDGEVPGTWWRDVLIRQNGIDANTLQLREWARRYGGSHQAAGELAIPRLADGNYEVCLNRVDDDGRLGRDCQSGYLGIGGELRIRRHFNETEEGEEE